MSHGPFPLFKLATLIARQLSAPIATRVKTYAKQHPLFSRVICTTTAELYRYGEWRVRVLALRAAGRVSGASEWWTRNPPPPLSPDAAREVGGNLVGEIVLFLIGCAIITYEVNRQAMIKEKMEEDERLAWRALKTLLEETRHEAQHQQEVIDRLRARLRDHLAYSSGGGGHHTGHYH
ncbi:hypothetical protein O0L34_g3744 [Tuta absoluta]|nr:hypothetical protein O0L34_g3744 [Tuta absoluta]